MPRELSIKFHPKQREIYNEIQNNEARFICLNCGRRFGKTYLCIKLVVINALQGKEIAYVCPSYQYMDEVYSNLKQEFEGLNVLKTANYSLKKIETSNGGVIRFYSTDKNDDATRGFSYDLVIVDEAGLIPNLIYTIENAIMGTLLERKGKLIIVSTPKSASGGFYKIFQQYIELSKIDSSYKCFVATTYDNPFIPVEEIERAKKVLSEWTFLQEYLAIPCADSGQVFKGIDDVLIDTISSEIISYFGIDVAGKGDFTVITGFNRNNEMIELHRFQCRDWNDTKEKVKDKVYKTIPICWDNTGAGAPLADDLIVQGYNLFPVTLGPKYKPMVIEQLIADIQSANLKIYRPKADLILKEMETYDYYKNEIGKMSYSARTGYNDDCISSLALGNWYHHTQTMQPVGLTSPDEIYTGESGIIF